MPAVAKHRKALAENLRRCRKEKELSQEKLAEKADLHPGYLSTLERGVKTISVDALVRLAKGLNVTVEELVRGI